MRVKQVAKISVALVDDDPAILDSLSTYLRRRGLAVSALNDAQELLRLVDLGEEFDCVVTDIRMPGISGIELHRELVARRRLWPVIFITGHGDVGIAVAALKTGAADFIEKPTDDQRLLASIKDAVAAMRERNEESAARAEIYARYQELSDRQREVMNMSVRGMPNKEIARQLGISPRTVEHYREWMMERMRAATFAELVQMAVSLGIVG